MACSSLKKYSLLFLSIIIYAFLAFKSLPFIIIGLIISYFGALFLSKRKSKVLLSILIIFNVSIFLSFKLNLWSQSILAPLGLAYYTLEIISYIVDIYKDKYPVCFNFLDYALYIFYLPHLFLGPINRYDEFIKSLKMSKITKPNLELGLVRILIGLVKKLIIAGRASILITSLTSFTEGGTFTLCACFIYSILLYTDFSGGIDIVLGLSNMLGLSLPENFDRPFFKTNIKEFWQSWHMSLSLFLKDYIYIPLGGNRKSKLRTKINIIITFLVSGLWHGINYIIWGLFHGIFVAFPRFTKTKSKCLNRIIMIVIVSLLWVFFIYPNTFMSLKMLGSIFTTFNYHLLASSIFNLGLSLGDFIVFIISILILFIYESRLPRIKEKYVKLSIYTKLIIILSLILIIILFGIYGIGFEVNEFIYSKF